MPLSFVEGDSLIHKKEFRVNIKITQEKAMFIEGVQMQKFHVQVGSIFMLFPIWEVKYKMRIRLI